MSQHSVRLDSLDEEILAALARRLGYTRSDTFRYGIRAATVALSLRLPRPINDRLVPLPSYPADSLREPL
jgi:hypothetical protein